VRFNCDSNYNCIYAAILATNAILLLLAKKLKEILITEYKIKNIDLGFLDITFFRDDFGRKNKILRKKEI